MASKICCSCHSGRAALLAVSIIFLAASAFLAACAPTPELAVTPSTLTHPARTGQLTPYLGQPARRNVTNSPVPANLSTATPQPSPTATPRTHEVKKGEDLGGIAWKYRVSLEALMAANPTVQPNMMSVGTKLVIPPSQTQLPGEDNPASSDMNLFTPTPVPLSTGYLSCTRVEDGGVWCFLPVHHSQKAALEGLSAVFHLSGKQSSSELAPQVLTQMAFLPLDRLEPGAWLPLVAYFPPEQMAALVPPYQAASELLSALPSAEDGRYLPIHLENQKVMLAENGRSASLTADIHQDSRENARRVWVAAVAYDAQGNVVGVRRWEKQDAQPLQAGQVYPLSMSVYSVSSKIERVELYVEARP